MNLSNQSIFVPSKPGHEPFTITRQVRNVRRGECGLFYGDISEGGYLYRVQQYGPEKWKVICRLSTPNKPPVRYDWANMRNYSQPQHY